MKNFAYALCFLFLGCGGSTPLSVHQPLAGDGGSVHGDGGSVDVDGATPSACSAVPGHPSPLGGCCSEWVPCDSGLTCVGPDTNPGSIGTCAATTPPTTCSISASSYDQSCTQDSDCVPVFQTMTCDDLCDCPNAAVNANVAAQYSDDLHSRVHIVNVCDCASETPRCIDSVCAMPGN